jgi:two-component system sensor histidine kinase/response regulator
LDGDEGLMQEIVALFLDMAPAQMTALRNALARGDSKDLFMTAHSLKGAAGNLQAGATFKAALRLEKLGREGNLAEAPAALDALDQELDRLLSALTTYATRRESTAPVPSSGRPDNPPFRSDRRRDRRLDVQPRTQPRDVR